MQRVAILSSADPRQKRGLQVVALEHAKTLRKYGFETLIFCPSLLYTHLLFSARAVRRLILSG